jgi:hypothetical protein
MSKQIVEASWKALRGKRTYHQLEPAMLVSKKVKVLNTRLTPYSEYPANAEYQVVFDREYAIEKVRRDLTLPLGETKLGEVLGLVIEAWCFDHPGISADNLRDRLHELI